MKKILYIIIMLTIFTSFTPLHANCCFAQAQDETISKLSVSVDDDLLQRAEHVHVNYVCDKKADVSKFIKVFKQVEIYNAISFAVLEFNEFGLLNEIIKRDYSGDDPVCGDSVYINTCCDFSSVK